MDERGLEGRREEEREKESVVGNGEKRKGKERLSKLRGFCFTTNFIIFANRYYFLHHSPNECNCNASHSLTTPTTTMLHNSLCITNHIH